MSSSSAQYLAFPFVFEKIIIRVICLGNHPAHLTFSPERHETAKQWLRDTLGPQGIADNTGHHYFADFLLEFFEGRRQKFPPHTKSPFIEKATCFQKRVWDTISEIPYGGTKTYGELAIALGKPGAARAVGQACNANPLAIIVPCHRVVSSSGLGGFAGGCEAKQMLHLLEQKSLMREIKNRL